MENSNIEWCDHTFNPWWGCTKVSPACDNCYAAALDKRTGGNHWGVGVERRRTSPANWAQPAKWNKNHDAFFKEHGRRQRVFCASMADVFDNEVDPQWRADLFELIAETPNLDWLLLTKRIGNAAKMIPDAVRSQKIKRLPTKTPSWPWTNVWIGATICNQAEADRDIPKLLNVPAAKRFLSIEPMLGAIDISAFLPNSYECGLSCGYRCKSHPQYRQCEACSNPSGMWDVDKKRKWYKCPDCKSESDTVPVCPKCDHYMAQDHPLTQYLDWVIVGGESGANARPMHPDWVGSLRDQCSVAEVSFFFKQWGEWHQDKLRAGGDLGGDLRRGAVQHVRADRENDGHFRRGDVHMRRVGKKSAGRLLDGVACNGVPA